MRNRGAQADKVGPLPFENDGIVPARPASTTALQASQASRFCIPDVKIARAGAVRDGEGLFPTLRANLSYQRLAYPPRKYLYSETRAV